NRTLAPQASASAIPPLARAPAGLTGSLRRGRARNDTSRCPIRGTNRPRAAGDPTLVDKDVTGRRTPPGSRTRRSHARLPCPQPVRRATRPARSGGHSESFAEGETLSAPQLGGVMGVEGGQDRSPQVSWSAGPEGTESYVVTLFDPDAPTASGFWHWSVANIPASVTSLPEGACTGQDTSGMPEGAVVVRNDAGFK